MKALSVFMDDDDMKQVEKYYEEDKDIYVLKDGISKDERENLDHLLEKPMMLYYGMCSGSDEQSDDREHGSSGRNRSGAGAGSYARGDENSDSSGDE